AGYGTGDEKVPASEVSCSSLVPRTGFTPVVPPREGGVLGRYTNGAGSRFVALDSYPVPDLNRCYRRERAASWAARRTGRGLHASGEAVKRWGTRTRT